MKKKVLHILNSSIFSGAESVAVSIIKGTSKDYESAYVSKAGAIEEKLNVEGIVFFPVISMNVFELKKIIKLYKPDLIHAHDFTTSVVTMLTGTNIPIVSHIHNNASWIKRINAYSVMYFIASRKIKKILCVSDSIVNEYIFGKYIKSKSIIVDNPVNLDVIKSKSIENNSDLECDIVFVGRLVEEKDPLRFIDIISELKSDFPAVKVCMIGEGHLSNECILKIRKLGLEKNIKLLGFLENPYTVMRNSKILCMTSKWEGYGLVAIEAMTLGIPVVATPVGGLKKIVNENTGYLTNEKSEYLSELNLLLSNDSYMKKKVENAKLRATKFNNYDTYMEEMISLYRNIEKK